MTIRQLSPIVALLVGLAAPACAQRSGPAPANCTGVFRGIVESERQHPRLSACASALVPQIVEELGDARRHSQPPQQLARFYSNASAYRDPAIARAALALAQDRTAPAPSQMLGWMLAVSQIQRGLYLRSLGQPVEAWFNREVTRCDWGDPTDVFFYRDRGLPAGFEAELERAAQAAAADPGRPKHVRDFAQCVARLLPYSTPGA